MFIDIVSSWNVLEGWDLLAQGDIFEPTTPDAPEELTSPLKRVVSLVKAVVLFALLIGGIASLASAVNAKRTNEPAIAHFGGMGMAALAAVVVYWAESILNFVAV